MINIYKCFFIITDYIEYVNDAYKKACRELKTTENVNKSRVQ
jgi:hypothetical protein